MMCHKILVLNIYVRLINKIKFLIITDGHKIFFERGDSIELKALLEVNYLSPNYSSFADAGVFIHLSCGFGSISLGFQRQHIKLGMGHVRRRRTWQLLT